MDKVQEIMSIHDETMVLLSKLADARTVEEVDEIKSRLEELHARIKEIGNE